MTSLKLFENKHVRSEWDAEREAWHFSIVDVVAVLTESADPAAYWRKLKQRLKAEGNETVTNCHGLKMRAPDGKLRLTDVADTEKLLRLIQSIPSPKAEPFKQWLARVGYERIEDPVLALGRGRHYPIALEGALKLKEISYIHAEAYPAGELKHGPLALVDADMPVISVAPNDPLLDKLKSNLREVQARGGELYVFADADSEIQASEGVHILRLPEHYGELSPILHAIPLQLLAYHAALVKGTDVDKPRNLAKSVTVE